MYHHPAYAKRSRRVVSSPSWRGILATWTVAAATPVIMMAVSYPAFGGGLLAVAILAYAARNADVDLDRHDPVAVLRALRPDEPPVKRTDPDTEQ